VREREQITQENEKREMRDASRIERDVPLDEQEGWFIYRDCPY
jgi:hypothetical protein